MRYLKSSLAIFLSLLMFSAPAFGQVSDAMDKHFGNMKGYTTSTSAGHYQGQTQNVYTLGSFSYRQEQQSYQLSSVQLPKIKSGCGGIDIFKGGFSFISGDQLKAMMRNILQNATTYAFKLAIDTVSPLIGKVMGELTSLVERVNGFNINSCETAMSAVDSLVTNLHQAAGTTCAQMGADKGIFSDSFAGRMNCNNDAASIAAMGTPAEKAAAPVNRNYGYDATKTNSLYGSDTEMREFLMSVSGTQISRMTTGTDGVDISVQYVPPIALDDGAINVLMSGGSLRIHQCAPAAAGEEPCLTVNPLGKTVTVSSSDAFRTKVDAMLSSIYDKVSGANSSPLTEAEVAFINETTLPIYKAIDVYSQALPVQGKSMILNYSDLIAYEMVLKFLIDQSSLVIDGAQTITGGERETMEAWRAGVMDNRRRLEAAKDDLNDRYQAAIAFIDSVRSLEGDVAARLITTMSDNNGSTVSGNR